MSARCRFDSGKAGSCTCQLRCKITSALDSRTYRSIYFILFYFYFYFILFYFFKTNFEVLLCLTDWGFIIIGKVLCHQHRHDNFCKGIFKMLQRIFVEF